MNSEDEDQTNHEMCSIEQSWFWTAEWQAGEREADADIDAGRVRRFKTIDELIESLGE